jgi:hypothetical protein
MDTDRLVAAVIRGFWTVVFPLIGSLVVYLMEPGVLESVGVTNATIALVIGAALYAVKKFVWPDTKF